MTKRVSVKGLANEAIKADTKARTAMSPGFRKKQADPAVASTVDSFLNLAAKMGLGADNLNSYSTYGFNPISRNRTLLEWIHRGSWIGGLAVDIPADDMTRCGIEITTEMDPVDIDNIERYSTAFNFWGGINETIKWGRLYGGAIGVALLDGQDPRTPLRLNTVGQGQFKGLITFDRWMVEPSLTDLVTDLGPHLGLPKYYRVTMGAPALRGAVIHHSRVLVRHVGIKLPFQQALQENLWGISVLERLYDRMVAYDSTSTGVAQLVYKAYLRTLSVEGLREIAAGPPKAMEGLTKYVDMMRRFQSIEGITMIDAKDKLEQQTHQAFSGLSDVMLQFGQQISGALQIPLVRLLGQSPAGLNSTGESDLRIYNDGIRQKQKTDIYVGVNIGYQLMARSRGIVIPDNFAVTFKPLRELDDKEKGEVSKQVTDTVIAAYDANLISQQTAMQELRQQSRVTGVFSNISREDIAAADADISPPEPETPPGAFGMPGEGGDPTQPPFGSPGAIPGASSTPRVALKDDEDANEEVRPQRTPPQVGEGSGRRVKLQGPAQ